MIRTDFSPVDLNGKCLLLETAIISRNILPDLYSRFLIAFKVDVKAGHQSNVKNNDLTNNSMFNDFLIKSKMYDFT